MVDIDELTGATREAELIGQGYEQPEAQLIASLERGESDGCTPAVDEPVVTSDELAELDELDT